MTVDPGDRIGPYEIVRRIGRGSMGVVYEARDTVRGRGVALKIMAASMLAEDAARTRFLREARAVASLRHRNIVAVYDCAEHGDTPYLVMELLAGVTLAERLQTTPPLSLDATLDIVIQLCEGLQFAHDQGVVHRDVKPANIRLLPDGAVKLLDFGIATIRGAVTQPGAVVGSAAYMSPEQIAGDAVDGRADVFSAGVVLFELLTGHRPFDGETITSVMFKILHEAPPSLRADVPDIPEDVEAAFRTAVEKDPSLRYAAIADFGADLRLARYALPSVPMTPHAQPMTPRAQTTPAPVVLAHVDTPPPARLPAPAPESRDSAASSPGGAEPQAVLSPTLDVTVPLVVDRAPIRPAVWPTWEGVAAASRRLSKRAIAAAVGVLLLSAIGYGVMRSRPLTYQIDVQSDPPGAAIVVDGVPAGRVTPAVLQSTSKPARLNLALAGFAPFEIAIGDIPARSPVPIRADLLRLVRVASEPPNAAIVVDGQVTGHYTPSEVAVPGRGNPEIELRLPGFVHPSIPPEAVASGSVRVLLTRGKPVPVTRGPENGLPSGPRPTRTTRVSVRATGDYLFELDGSCVSELQPASRTHELKVDAPCKLRLRADRYLLDATYNIDGTSALRDLRAPPAVAVDLRTKYEGCAVWLNGRYVALPLKHELAQTTYTVAIDCQDGRHFKSPTGALDLSSAPHGSSNGRPMWRLDDFLVR